MPFFSVVIPTCNRVVFLRKALDSVFAQTFTDYEVIVVDDGSVDETLVVVERIGGSIRLFSQENRGQGAARNLGLQKAEGKYIAFLDSDDIWFTWTLSIYHEVIWKSGCPAFVAGTEIPFVNTHPCPEMGGLDICRGRCYDDYLSLGNEAPWVPPSATAIRRDVLLQAGGFSEERMNYEECDLWLRLGIARGFVRVEDPPLVARRVHPGNITSQANNNLRGIQHMLESEQRGRYPGGRERQIDRIRVITRHLRPFSVACVRAMRIRHGLSLYVDSLWWHFRLGRYKYVFTFPIFIIFSVASTLIARAIPRQGHTHE
jgi:glycosyltransferase involved in cell wall biosynthesis